MWHPLGREKLKLRCHSNDWQVALTTWRKSQKFRKVLATNTEQMSLRFWGIPHPKLGNFPSDFEEKLLTKHRKLRATIIGKMQGVSLKSAEPHFCASEEGAMQVSFRRQVRRLTNTGKSCSWMMLAGRSMRHICCNERLVSLESHSATWAWSSLQSFMSKWTDSHCQHYFLMII